MNSLKLILLVWIYAQRYSVTYAFDNEFTDNDKSLILKFNLDTTYDNINVEIDLTCNYYLVKNNDSNSYRPNGTQCNLMKFVEGQSSKQSNSNTTFIVKFDSFLSDSVYKVKLYSYTQLPGMYTLHDMGTFQTSPQQPSEVPVIMLNTTHLEIKALSNKNGEILQYLLFIFSNENQHCIKSIKIIISKDLIGFNGQIITCETKPTVVDSNFPFIYKLAENELYSTISVQAANRWGYGLATKITLTTTSNPTTTTSKPTTTTSKPTTTTSKPTTTTVKPTTTTSMSTTTTSKSTTTTSKPTTTTSKPTTTTPKPTTTTSKSTTTTSKSTTTISKSSTTYTSMSPEDLIKIMKQEILTNYDRQHQISITLPISALTNEMRFVCVVVSNGPIISKQGLWINKPDACYDVSYFHCIGKSSCTYEIRVNLPNRQKRQVTNENLPMIIGSMDNCNQSHYCNGKLTPGQTYKIGMRAYSDNSYSTIIEINKSTEPSNTALIIAISVSVSVLAVIVIVVVVVVIKRKQRKNKYNSADDSRPSISSQAYLTEREEAKDKMKSKDKEKNVNVEDVQLRNINENNAQETNENELDLNIQNVLNQEDEQDDLIFVVEENEYEEISSIKVKVKDYHEKLKLLMSNNQKMIKEEFERIKEYSKMMLENHTVELVDIKQIGAGPKNRFANIIPYKHNAITLQNNEFINACVVCSQSAHWTIKSSCNCNEVFIVTQGPIGDDKPNKQSTVADFWQMVAEQNIDMIVMLTNVSEFVDNTNKEKCGKYWPDPSEILNLRFKKNLIRLELEDIRENHIYCDRRIKFTFNNESRTIIQLQLKLWMDHSFPERELFLDFYDTFVSFRDRNLATRTIVHCSAGAGRTCTFILLDVLARSVSSPDDELCLFQALKDLRQVRTEAVQSFKQYLFLYDILGACFKRQFLLGKRNTFTQQVYLANKRANNSEDLGGRNNQYAN